MRRPVFAPRFALLLIAGSGAWSACSGDSQDFFGNPGSAGGSSATAGTSGESASAGKAGERSSGGSSGSAGEGGKSGGSGSGGTSAGGSPQNGDAGEAGGGGNPPGGQGGEANGGAGMSGAPNEAGAPSHAGEGGEAGDGASGGTSGTGGNPNAGTSGGGSPSGGSSGSGGNPNGGASGSPQGGSNANGGTSGSSGHPNGGTGGIPISSCHNDGDCQNAAEYCKKSSCAAQAGECAPRPETCTGANAIFAPVCGCDGMTYFSACVAAREGTNVASSGECNPATAATCTRTAGGESCMPSRKLARCYRPRATCTQPSPSTGTCWVLPDECPSAEPETAYYCRGGTDPAGCIGLCALLDREDSVVREAAECK